MMKNLLLLHGALGSADDFTKLHPYLEDEYIIHRFHFAGHGGEPIPKESFSVPLFVKDVEDYLKHTGLSSVYVFGYSMGGYVGMYLARHNPSCVAKLATLGTKFLWNEAIATKEAGMMNPEIIQQKVPAFAKQLQQKHSMENWEGVLDKTALMLNQMGLQNPLLKGDFTEITQPVMLLSGDRDKMVPLSETMDIYKQLPDARFGVLPGTPHIFDQVDVELLAFTLKKFFL